MMHRYPADQRGKTQMDWLDSKHSFSFADYYNPHAMSFRSLRVINEDVIAGAGGFGTHPHQNMEIITYVISGQLEHKDSQGNVGTIEHGEIQCMSAGTGIRHSEYNPSATTPVHLYQIWLTPHSNNKAPSYQQKQIPIHAQRNQLHLIASPKQNDGALDIHQDAQLFAGEFDHDQEYSIDIAARRHAWLQVVRGSVTASDPQQPEHTITLHAGDGLSVSEQQQIHIQAQSEHEILLFDLA